jgi:5-methylcytosine-specific restriction endonuclease McrA
VGVEFDEENQLLFTRVNARRVDITSCRDSLNGYQKGRCFYCFRPISLVPGDPELADVDHFIPWAARNEVGNINGVWNLVLACQCCNRGVEGKSARIPKVRLLSAYIPETSILFRANCHYMRRLFNKRERTQLHG